ncbi:MAG: cupin domain-containing protein [Candidatus Bathyarchaeia archaeon]
MKVVESDDVTSIPLFNEVTGKIPFTSDRVMFLLVEIPPREEVPMHSHPHEQMGICLKGRAEFISDDEKKIVEEGAFYWIKPEENHSVVSLTDEKSIFLDVFNPPREDYIQMLNELKQT